MKILSILFLVILLATTMGCGSQDATRANPGSTIPLDVREEALWDAPLPEAYFAQMLSFEIQFAELREELEALDARLTNLEEKIGGVLFPNLYFPQSIEARLKALEQEVLGFNREFALPPFPEDNLSQLERRISAIEDKLGINRFSWPWP